MKTMFRGTIHGKMIELKGETGLPDGQDVLLSLEPFVAQTGSNGVNDDQSKALAVRKAWMRRKGFAEEEIEACCLADEGRLDLAEELDNLRAVEELERITPSSNVLNSWATDL